MNIASHTHAHRTTHTRSDDRIHCSDTKTLRHSHTAFEPFFSLKRKKALLRGKRLKKEKKGSFERKKAQKNPRSSASLRGPCGAIFAEQKSASATFVPRENARREWPSKEGCLDRLRRCEPHTQAHAHDDSPTPCGIPFT